MLEWGQLFLEKILCWGNNFPGWAIFSRGNFPRNVGISCPNFAIVFFGKQVLPHWAEFKTCCYGSGNCISQIQVFTNQLLSNVRSRNPVLQYLFVNLLPYLKYLCLLMWSRKYLTCFPRNYKKTFWQLSPEAATGGVLLK